MVRFKKGSITEKLSKRKGTAIPLTTLVEEIGPDACRYLFLSKSHESQVEFDLDLAKKQSSENPIYYIQYAHARICSILKSANNKNIHYSEHISEHYSVYYIVYIYILNYIVYTIVPPLGDS